MQNTDIMAALTAPFSAADVDWRVQHATQDKKRGLVVPYVKSRAIQSRLDQVVGPFHWKDEYKPWHTVNGSASQLCGISIYCEERGEWVQKWDGAENTDIEPVKGGISDAFKRAAVLWGVGRYLYGLSAVWVDLEIKGKTPSIPDSALRQLNATYEKMVGAPPSNVSGFPGGPAPPSYEYAVRSVEQRQFASGNGLVLRLTSADGKTVEAFVQRADQKLSEGVCLKNVTLTPFESGGYQSHIMADYEVA